MPSYIVVAKISAANSQSQKRILILIFGRVTKEISHLLASDWFMTLSMFD